MEFKFVERVQEVLEYMIPGLKMTPLALAS
jgi:hypothetical protein